MTTRWSILLTVKPPAFARGFMCWLALKKPQPDISVAADASGRWALRTQPDGAWHAVALTRWWRGPFWVTLTLVASAMPTDVASTSEPASQSRPAWTLTLWRRAVPKNDWRTLNVLLRAAHQRHLPSTAPA